MDNISSVRVASTTPLLSSQASAAPFNLAWLAYKFYFETSDVDKAEFDAIGNFEVYFKADKKRRGKQIRSGAQQTRMPSRISRIKKFGFAQEGSDKHNPGCGKYTPEFTRQAGHPTTWRRERFSSQS